MLYTLYHVLSYSVGPLIFLNSVITSSTSIPECSVSVKRPKRCGSMKLQSLPPYYPLCQLQSQTIDLGTHDTLARAAVKWEICPLHLLVLILWHGFILTKVPRCEALAQEM